MKTKFLDSMPRPFIGRLDPLLDNLMETLSLYEMQSGIPFSIAGGAVRDHGKKAYNDIDVITNDHDIRRRMEEVGLLDVIQTEDGEFQDYFTPYDGTRVPIHFIPTESDLANAPSNFDFSINRVVLKSDMQLHASQKDWKDYDLKLLRYNEDMEINTNAVMRAVRFHFATDYSLCTKTLIRIQEFLSEAVNGKELPEGKKHLIASNRILVGIEKMKADGVAEPCFAFLQEVGMQIPKEVTTLDALADYHRDLISNGNAYIQQARHYF